MALGLLIAAGVTALLAAWIWHRVNDTRDDDTGLVTGMLGVFGGLGMFIALFVLAGILLVAAGVVWVVGLF